MENGNNAKQNKFYSGVIEGFYNRPWTMDQRLDLFKKIKKYKMNSYLYAPKDDLKHRSEWRQLYTEAECTQLKQLITSCRENDVTFIYGISPGLDIVYSDSTEFKYLVDKTKQIQQLGCQGFAILWDDIEPELSSVDAKHFDSFGHAHCKISNDLFHELNSPEFLFCPVEYCAKRAVPSVQDSEYLQAIGKLLHSDIQVFWTGTNVVSRVITVDEIRHLEKVIKRKPIIWDNYHANDYDLQRVYLGPYIGRERSIPPSEYLSGSMTNPNCEYSLNIPALVTLADWVNNPKWDPSGLPSHKLAVREMLAETRIPGPGESASISTRKGLGEEDELTESDLDLLFQMFWLPHSHGPKMKRLLEDFKYCKENAMMMMGWKNFEPGDQPDLIDKWIDRASYVNKISKQFFRVFDKLTHIANRSMLFDLNGYLNNVRLILNGCNNYLKWVGLQECKKPIRGGPTLAGLPGGFAGDLMRLYPIQSENMYPLQSLVTASENALMVLPARNPNNLLPDLQQVFKTPDFTQYTSAFTAASDCFVVKMKCRRKVQIVGFVCSWRPLALAADSRKGILESIHKVFAAEKVNKKYSAFIKMFFVDQSKVLDSDLLDQILESILVKGDGLVIGNHETEEFVARFLQLSGFSTLKTDVMLANCDLFAKIL